MGDRLPLLLSLSSPEHLAQAQRSLSCLSPACFAPLSRLQYKKGGVSPPQEILLVNQSHRLELWGFLELFNCFIQAVGSQGLGMGEKSQWTDFY